MIATKRGLRLTEEICRDMRAAKAVMVRLRDPRPYFDAAQNVQTAIERGQMTLEDISITKAWDELVPDGKAIREAMGRYSDVELRAVMEADAVKSTDFEYLMHRMLSGQVLREYDMADMIGDSLATMMTSRFRSERIPGISGLGDAAEQVDEGMPYPLVGVGSNYVDTPPTVKRGMIVPITREAVFFDQTGVLVERCRQVAKWMRLNKEKRIIQVATGAVNNWSYNGTAYNTYQNGGGSELFDNTVGSNTLTSGASLTAAEQLMSVLTDPMTGEYIDVSGLRTILVGTITLRDAALKIVGATEVRELTNSGNTITIGRNIKTGYSVLYSPYVADYADANHWFLGDFKRAFRYRANWGIETDTAGGSSDDAFSNDIVLKFKVSEMASAEVNEPRYVCENADS